MLATNRSVAQSDYNYSCAVPVSLTLGLRLHKDFNSSREILIQLSATKNYLELPEGPVAKNLQAQWIYRQTGYPKEFALMH